MVSVTRTASTKVSVQFQPACFACGADSPHDLQLNFQVEPETGASATWVPDAIWEGLRGIVHGGIVTTLLDEAMAKAVASAGWYSEFLFRARGFIPCRATAWLNTSTVNSQACEKSTL